MFRAAANLQSVPDPVPFGGEANRKAQDMIIAYAAQRALIPRHLSVDEFFDDTTCDLN